MKNKVHVKRNARMKRPFLMTQGTHETQMSDGAEASLVRSKDRKLEEKQKLCAGRGINRIFYYSWLKPINYFQMEESSFPEFIKGIHDICSDRQEQSVGDIVNKTVEKLKSVGREDTPFFLVNIQDVKKKLTRWKKLLPRVEPFYAVKCNNDPKVVKVLVQAETGFDCASQAEIQQILQLDVPPSKIVFANPCKFDSHLTFAAKKNVDLMTFDDEHELEKIKRLFPNARLLLRIKTNDKFKVKQSFNKKYGCDMTTAVKLLEKAKTENMNVVGISFHVGCVPEDDSCFPSAISDASELFKIGTETGHTMTILDIGGGFPGAEKDKQTFENMSVTIMGALDEHFPESRAVRIIAEPGRYVVTSAFTLASKIVAKRIIHIDQNENDISAGSSVNVHGSNVITDQREAEHSLYMYYLNDGIYGAFGNVLIDHVTVKPNYLNECDTPSTRRSILWGPTCDSIDCVMTECLLPEMSVGQWLYFKDMGAYTVTVMCDFNGIPRPLRFYICDTQTWAMINSDKPSLLTNFGT
ncbi:Mitochondrial 2-oxoadipate and 2-oxoglutarate transporter [Bulinus truncatus]|nr:Mitochondrial 2-oxoadipate and 2-oxoglutarate transporter [Bulinus truncatus]